MSTPGKSMLSTFRMKSLCRASIVLGLFLGMAGETVAQGERCDSRIKPITGTLGYSWREQGQRCEGLYESTVSAINLEVVSVLKGNLRFDFERHEILQLFAPDVSGLGPNPVRVRAVALPLKTYFRMDAVMPPSGAMVWPLGDIVERVKLPVEKIGIFGWVGSETDKIFVPLEVFPKGERPAQGTDAPVELVVRSAGDIEQLVWRTSVEEMKMTNWQEFPGVPLRAGQPVTLVLPGGTATVLRVEVAAKGLNIDKWTKLNIRLFRPGR